MKRMVASALVSLAVLPAYSLAGVQVVSCPFSHFVRDQGREMRTSVLAFRNMDLQNWATIQRITVRNAFGNIIHDSGPHQHPLSSAFGGLDITQIPPGASLFLLSSDFWGLFNVPGGPPSQGFLMTVTVEVAKEGNASLLAVGSARRSRERITNEDTFLVSEGADRSGQFANCTNLKSG